MLTTARKMASRGLGLYPGDPCYDQGRVSGAKSLIPHWVDTDQEHACLVSTGRAQPDFLDDWINSWAYIFAPEFPSGVYPAPGVPSGVLTNPNDPITQDDINAGNRVAHTAYTDKLRDMMQEDPFMDRGNWGLAAAALGGLILVAVKLNKK